MPTFDGASGGGDESVSATLAIVIYTATGSEGTSFLVPIGSTLSTADYEILWSARDATMVPIFSLPDGVGDRTTTYFRVYSSSELTAGDKFTFVLYEAP